MALTNQQRHVLEIVRAIDDTGVFTLAGGGAINAHHVADRETHDLDLFTPALDKINDIVSLVIAELERQTILVTVTRRSSAFIQLSVGATETTIVEFAHDHRWLQPVETDVGLVLDMRELAADKMCALFGRAEIRDVMDLGALSERFTVEQMATWAKEKDPGFDIGITRQMLAAISPISLDQTEELRFDQIRSAIGTELERLDPDNQAGA